MDRLRIVKCYWDKCKEDVHCKWHPSRNPGSFLYVCKPHTDILLKLYETKIVKGEHYSLQNGY